MELLSLDISAKFLSIWCLPHDFIHSSDENGLYLVLGAVHEDGPAYECGLRSGDVIVTVSDWLITVMDKPEVRDIDWPLRIYTDYFTSGCSSPLPSRGKHCQARDHEAKWNQSWHHLLCARSEPRQEHNRGLLIQQYSIYFVTFYIFGDCEVLSYSSS